MVPESHWIKVPSDLNQIRINWLHSSILPQYNYSVYILFSWVCGTWHLLYKKLAYPVSHRHEIPHIFHSISSNGLSTFSWISAWRSQTTILAHLKTSRSDIETQTTSTAVEVLKLFECELWRGTECEWRWLNRKADSHSFTRPGCFLLGNCKLDWMVLDAGKCTGCTNEATEQPKE